MKRIGLFGGSFDPVHIGHLMVSRAALVELELDRLFFIPAAKSPFKPDSQPVAGELRLKMLRTALAAQPGCRVDDREIRRGGTSFTIDTVRYYHDRFRGVDLYYLIGADHIQSLPQWREAFQLAKLVHFAAIPRPGQEKVNFPDPFKGTSLKGFPLDLSSTQIRHEVQAGRTVELLVPQGVSEIIRNNRLYLSE